MNLTNYSWSSRVLPIACLFSFRMLGLFMLIPVFSLLAPQLQHAEPVLIGLALGIYGLTQGILQIPLGMLSDRIGRKPVIFLGLLIFIIGSLIGALALSIEIVILARALQGMGAIGSVLIALLADLTTEKERTKAMAVIGLTIGLSFAVAMVLSPLLANRWGLTGIFYFSVLLGCIGLACLTLIPDPFCLKTDKDAVVKDVTYSKKTILQKISDGLKRQLGFEYITQIKTKNPLTTLTLLKTAFFETPLQSLNLSIFIQHWILTATFLVLPLSLESFLQAGLIVTTWHFYVTVILISFVLMLPFIVIAEKYNQMKCIVELSIIFTAVSQFLFAYQHQHWVYFLISSLCYFLVFNILEAVLPSLVSKQASPNNKGTAMGMYSTSQFLGIFAGGGISGVLYGQYGIEAVYFLNGLLAVVWGIVNIKMKLAGYNKLKLP